MSSLTEGRSGRSLRQCAETLFNIQWLPDLNCDPFGVVGFGIAAARAKRHIVVINHDQCLRIAGVDGGDIGKRELERSSQSEGVLRLLKYLGCRNIGRIGNVE